eukprot:CAMPEP_0119031150 /NCGR_PEP_ID=MMETSP1176-20130426/41396_1 /TAXON_ID=265551 /ORGANISM="Synedropsis recta cf, Strain CCMP1620" /LENGTH=281 /DNA_ID=CAMNT_0006987537 /DNA_START=311 /DNA_END=1153 /DNA_ORIENTATION=+
MILSTSILTPKDQEPKAVVFFCHGFGDNAAFMKRHIAFRFVKEGIVVATIEYEGHGSSDGPLCLIPDFDRMVTDVVDYFQEVSTTRFMGKKCFLMGESMGGAVSFVAYKKIPSLFSGVEFVAPMCKVSDALKPAQWVIDLIIAITGPIGSNGYLGYLPIAPVKQNMDDLTHNDANMRNLSKCHPFLFGRKPRLTTARELLHVTGNITTQLAAFEAPFLVQHGLDDQITDPALSQALYDESISTDKTIKLYEGMKHALISDIPADSEIVLKDTIDWILERVD